MTVSGNASKIYERRSSVAEAEGTGVIRRSRKKRETRE